MKHTFELTKEYIELNKLLKFFSVGESGGHVKHMITDGLIMVNGEPELRIRKKCVKWDTIVCEQEDVEIEIV